MTLMCVCVCVCGGGGGGGGFPYAYFFIPSALMLKFSCSVQIIKDQCFVQY